MVCGVSILPLLAGLLMRDAGLRPKSLTKSTDKYLYYVMVVRRCCCCGVPDGVAFLCSFSSILYPRHSFVASDFVYLDPFLPSFTHLVADLLTETSRSLLAHM